MASLIRWASPPASVAARKKELVGKLNGYVVQTRAAKQLLKDKQELLGASGGGKAAPGSSWMGSLGWPSGGGGGAGDEQRVNLSDKDAVRGASNQQVMAAGRYMWEQDQEVSGKDECRGSGVRGRCARVRRGPGARQAV